MFGNEVVTKQHASSLIVSVLVSDFDKRTEFRDVT